MNYRKDLIFGTAIYTFSNLLIKFGGVLILPLISKLIKPEEFGIISILIPLSQLLTLVIVGGLYIAQAREYAYLKNEKRQLGSYLFTINLYLVLISIIIIFLLTNKASIWIWTKLFDIKTVKFEYIKLYVLAGVIGSFVLIANNYFQQEKKYLYISLVSLVGFIIDTTLTLILIIKFGMGIEGRNIAYIIWSLYLLIIFYGRYIKRFRIEFNFSYLKSSFSISIPIIFTSIFAYIINYSDRIILGKFLDLETVGFYSLAYNGAMVLSVFITAFNNAWIPIFNEKMAKNQHDKDLVTTLTKFILTLSFISLIGILYGNDLIYFFFPKEYHGATQFFPYLLAIMLLQGCYHYLVLFLNFNRDTKFIPLLTVSSALINLGVNIIFIPQFGALVAVWSTFLSFVFNVLCLFILIKIRYSIKFEYKKLVIVFCVSFNPILFYVATLDFSLLSFFAKFIYLVIFIYIFKNEVPNLFKSFLRC